MGDYAHRRQEEKPHSATRPNALREEYLVELLGMCERQHVVTENIEDGRDDDHWVKVARVEELSGEDPHEE